MRQTASLSEPSARIRPFHVDSVRGDFPILHRAVHGKPLVYLDNAATTQKPRTVIEAVNRFYTEQCASIHRAVHELSETATAEYEGARLKAQRFVGARSTREIVFVRGATEAINLVAQTHGRESLGPGDEVLITGMEHHSNIVPWQIVCKQTGARLHVAPITDAGDLDMDALDALIGPRTRLLAITHVSNALGTVNPVRAVVELAHARGALVLVDGAQAVPHLPIDVTALDCDFYVMSGHKMYGPTGVGVLWGREQLLTAMPPYQGGGDMIRSVTFEETIYAGPPQKFEAGTPNIEGVIGLGAAFDYLSSLDRAAIAEHEAALVACAIELLEVTPGITVIGHPKQRAAVVSFVMEGVHAHDLGTILDQEGIAIRTGHHCAQPLMERYGLTATARASFAMYNTIHEVEAMAAAVQRVGEVLHV